MTDLLVRHFDSDPFEVDSADGLTVRGLVVPFDVEANVVDVTPHGLIRYREVWRYGSCERAERAPHRIVLSFSHTENFVNALGYGRAMVQEPRGLVGTFRLYEATADKAREVLTTSHQGFSVGFASIDPRQGTEQARSIVERRKCHIEHVAAVAQGAYSTAGVELVRSADEEIAALDDDAAEAAERARLDREELDAVLAAQVERQSMLEARLYGT